MLNHVRLRYIHKGYMNQSELSEFLDVGRSRSKKIYETLKHSLEENGQSVDVLGIRTVHVLDYLGLSEEDVRRFAEDEVKDVINHG